MHTVAVIMAASDSGIDSQSSPETTERPTMSRTHQYRKVMKPMLERKRRARINKCLDELKDLMVFALQTEGESITKLEKADVLELTVRHLRKLSAQGGLLLSSGGGGENSDNFRAGFRACVGEIGRFVTSSCSAAGEPGIDLTVSARLLQHLSVTHQNLESNANLRIHQQPLPVVTHPTSQSLLNHQTSRLANSSPSLSQPSPPLQPPVIPLVRSLTDALSTAAAAAASEDKRAASAAAVVALSAGSLVRTTATNVPPTVVKAELTVIPPPATANLVADSTQPDEPTWRPW